MMPCETKMIEVKNRSSNGGYVLASAGQQCCGVGEYFFRMCEVCVICLDTVYFPVGILFNAGIIFSAKEIS